jgi:hypothetical protein
VPVRGSEPEAGPSDDDAFITTSVAPVDAPSSDSESGGGGAAGGGQAGLAATARARVVAAMRAAADTLAPHVETGEPFERYLARMARAGEWAGELEMLAAARLYRRTLRSAGPAPARRRWRWSWCWRAGRGGA